MDTSDLKLPTSFEETIDFLYEIQNMADAIERAVVLWTVIRAAAASAEPVAAINDKLQESSFRAGLKLGWNLAGDENAFKRAMDAHSWNELTAAGLYTHPAPDADIVSALEDNCWDLRCINIPTGGDDYDVGWNVVEHHQAAPKERVVGFGRSPREAVTSAITKAKEAFSNE